MEQTATRTHARPYLTLPYLPLPSLPCQSLLHRNMPWHEPGRERRCSQTGLPDDGAPHYWMTPRQEKRRTSRAPFVDPQPTSHHPSIALISRRQVVLTLHFGVFHSSPHVTPTHHRRHPSPIAHRQSRRYTRMPFCISQLSRFLVAHLP